MLIAVLVSQMFVLLLRVEHVGAEAPAVFGSLALIAATICLFVFALHAVYLDLFNMTNTSANDTPSASACEETGTESEEIEAGVSSQGSESPAEEKQDDPPPPKPYATSLPWSLLIMGNDSLCGAQTAEDDAQIKATGEQQFDELARLAIAAGVDRSVVSRLASAHSDRLAAT